MEKYDSMLLKFPFSRLQTLQPVLQDPLIGGVLESWSRAGSASRRPIPLHWAMLFHAPSSDFVTTWPHKLLLDHCFSLPLAATRSTGWLAVTRSDSSGRLLQILPLVAAELSIPYCKNATIALVIRRCLGSFNARWFHSDEVQRHSSAIKQLLLGFPVKKNLAFDVGNIWIEMLLLCPDVATVSLHNHNKLKSISETLLKKNSNFCVIASIRFDFK